MCAKQETGVGGEASGRWWPVVVSLAAIAVYAAAGARDVVWGESIKQTIYVYDLNFTLSQWNHAGSLLLSWPFSLVPIEPYAQRLHLFSAAMSGIGLGFLYSALVRLGTGRGPALVGVAATGVAHTVWMVSSMYESYPVVIFCLSLTAWLLVVKRPILAGLVLGFGALANPLCLFSMPAIVWLSWHSDSGKKGAEKAVFGVLLGWLLPSLAIVGFTASAKMEQLNWSEAFERYANLELLAKNLSLLGALALYNLAGPALVLVCMGLRQFSRTTCIGVGLLLATHYLFAGCWMIQRSYLIVIPVYLAASYPIALGARTILASRPALLRPLLCACIGLPILGYLVAPPIARLLPTDGIVRDAPYRDEVVFFLRPWKANDRSARRYLEDLERELPQGSLVLGDFVAQGPLRYAQKVEGWREDLVLFRIDHLSAESLLTRVRSALDAGRPVYLLDDEPEYFPERLAELGKLVGRERVESLFELRPGSIPGFGAREE
ncbi:MAG: hypothetical protein ABGY71_04710 [bacterium]|nr:hypothetical protein [Planctomycetota bacterium]HIL52464.1 hypothetical protein [Planctomycetota bacterium]